MLSSQLTNVHIFQRGGPGPPTRWFCHRGGDGALAGIAMFADRVKQLPRRVAMASVVLSPIFPGGKIGSPPRISPMTWRKDRKDRKWGNSEISNGNSHCLALESLVFFSLCFVCFCVRWMANRYNSCASFLPDFGIDSAGRRGRDVFLSPPELGGLTFLSVPWCRKAELGKSQVGDLAPNLSHRLSKTTGWWFGTSILFSHSVGNVIIPIDELIFFRGVAQPPTRLDFSESKMQK